MNLYFQQFNSLKSNIAGGYDCNKIKNDLIAQSVMQIKLAVDGFEIPKDYLTEDGKNFWNKQPTVIDKGMRFILELPNFNYSQEMLITEIGKAFL